MNTQLYDKRYAELTIKGITSDLDDLRTWDAYNDDILNPKVHELEEKLKEIAEIISNYEEDTINVGDGDHECVVPVSKHVKSMNLEETEDIPF